MNLGWIGQPVAASVHGKEHMEEGTGSEPLGKAGSRKQSSRLGREIRVALGEGMELPKCLVPTDIGQWIV